MDHAITVGDVAVVIGVGVSLVVLAGVCFGLLWLFNPFRSGH